MTLTPEQVAAYVGEFERRFRNRTPATQIDEILPATRVGRGEMRAWFSDQYGRPMTLDDVEALEEPVAKSFRKLRKMYPFERW